MVNLPGSEKIIKEYNLGEPVNFELLQSGKDNDVYSLIYSDGKKYVLRIAKRQEKDFVFEVELLRALAETDFLAPKITLTRSGQSTVNLGEQQGSLFNYVEGRHFDKVNEEMLLDGTIEAGGRKLGHLHWVVQKMAVKENSRRTIFTELDRLLAVGVKKFKQFDGYESLLKEAKEFRTRGEQAAKKSAVGIIHNDYRIQNLIFIGQELCLIDFDWACHGPFLKDVGLALAEWSLFDPESGPSKEAVDQFLGGYNSAAPFRVDFNSDAIFWICFACLSDACTFFADIIEGRYLNKQITDVNQCHMYKKFEYFYKLL